MLAMAHSMLLGIGIRPMEVDKNDRVNPSRRVSDIFQTQATSLSSAQERRERRRTGYAQKVILRALCHEVHRCSRHTVQRGVYDTSLSDTVECHNASGKIENDQVYEG
jgi:hypothetical protein